VGYELRLKKKFEHPLLLCKVQSEAEETAEHGLVLCEVKAEAEETADH
jgi:hypothetical protein